jgi:hypothetical protein
MHALLNLAEVFDDPASSPVPHVLPAPKIAVTMPASLPQVAAVDAARNVTLGGLIGRGYPGRPTPQPPASILDTRTKCPKCRTRFVLPELRYQTGDLCFTCAREVRS